MKKVLKIIGAIFGAMFGIFILFVIIGTVIAVNDNSTRPSTVKESEDKDIKEGDEVETFFEDAAKESEDKHKKADAKNNTKSNKTKQKKADTKDNTKSNKTKETNAKVKEPKYSNFYASLTGGITIPETTDIMPHDATVENGHIWIDKNKVLADPTNYLGKRAMFRGIIQKSVDGKMELSVIDNYETAVTALYDAEIYQQLPTTPIYEYITTVWGVIVKADNTDGVVIALDSIFASSEGCPDLTQYHTYDEIRSGNGSFDRIKIEGATSRSSTVGYPDIESQDGEFTTRGKDNSTGRVADNGLFDNRNYRIYGSLNMSTGVIEFSYIEPIVE